MSDKIESQAGLVQRVEQLSEEVAGIRETVDELQATVEQFEKGTEAEPHTEDDVDALLNDAEDTEEAESDDESSDDDSDDE